MLKTDYVKEAVALAVKIAANPDTDGMKDEATSAAALIDALLADDTLSDDERSSLKAAKKLIVRLAERAEQMGDADGKSDAAHIDRMMGTARQSRGVKSFTGRGGRDQEFGAMSRGEAEALLRKRGVPLE